MLRLGQYSADACKTMGTPLGTPTVGCVPYWATGPVINFLNNRLEMYCIEASFFEAICKYGGLISTIGERQSIQAFNRYYVELWSLTTPH